MNNAPTIIPKLSEAANALRFLAMDAVEKANSGHPGMPMGMADIATTLWHQFLRHNPANPHWPNRDRFVLSNGHGSMLLYALLHLSGYDLPMQELQRFRQLHSKTPGHPENTCTVGVETTTGPLGQGLANAVGMALAEKLLAAEFNRPGLELVDHTTWVFLGDGCLMEGISHEACSLAGTWQLGKLICFYDDNGISIDGHVKGWFTDDTPQRFAAYGWQVLADVNGHDEAEVAQAIRSARSNREQPTLICCKTIIGLGAPTKAGSHDAHGAALGAKEVAAARELLHWPHAPFVIPPSVRQTWDARSAGARAEGEWQALLDRYRKAHPAEAAEFTRRIAGDLPAIWPDHVRQFLAQVQTKAESIASRKASQNCLEGYGPVLPELLGGSADLTGSNLTNWSRSKMITAQGGGNYLHYGVREFAMMVINNGIALHGGFIPYGGTFLTFSDYSRNGLRMAALMQLRNISVFTHDSIGLGEDGPTHQPIEHLATLRLIPNMDVWRPCDTHETAVAWASAIERRNGPSSLCLSRQNLPFVPRTPEQAAMVARGGYTLRDVPAPLVVLLATGSEVAVALQAQEKLRELGIAARVVSLPCTNLFDRQDEDYRRSVLPPGVPRVSVEAGITGFWYRYVGLEGAAVGIDSFGESAPAGELFKFFGITAERVTTVAQGVIRQYQNIAPLA